MQTKGIALMIFLLLIMFSSTANAQTSTISTETTKTQQIKSIEGYIGYIESMKPPDIYSFNVNFLPPDGISKIEGVEIIFTGDFASETIFSVKFNGMACTPERWATPKIGAANYKMTFSCIDNIREAKDIKIFRIEATSDQEARNIIGLYKINYQSDWNLPEEIASSISSSSISITTGATDYEPGDNATIFAKIISETIIADAFCDYMVFNGTNIFRSGLLNYVPNSRGLYTSTFRAPNTNGTYPIDIECIRPINGTKDINYFRTGLFIRNATGATNASITLSSVGINELCYPDRFSQYVGDFKEYAYIENITSIYGWFEKGGAGSAEYTNILKFYLETYYGEILIGSVTSTSTIQNNPTLIIFENLTNNQPVIMGASLEVEWCARKSATPTQDITFHFNSTAHNSRFTVSTITRNQTLDFLIGGSSELNVKNTAAGNTAGSIWSYPNRTLTDYNQTLMWNYLQQIDGNVSIYIPSLINQMNDSININFASIRSRIDDINTSLYDRITAINISIMNKLYSVQEDLQNITDGMAEIMLLIGDVNQSLYDRLFLIQNDINSLSIQIDAVNVSLSNNLYNIQQQISDVNESLVMTILLLSNASVNITLNQEALFDDMIALWGDNFGSPKMVTMGFTGMVSAAPDAQYFCIDNFTLGQNVSIDLDTPSGMKNYIRTMRTNCVYGCKSNTCILPDYSGYFLLIIFAVGGYLIYRHFSKE